MPWSAPAICIVEIAVSTETAPGTIVLVHGARRLPGVEVISYNVELKDEAGFVGDRASKGAFRHFIDEWRKPLRRIGQDPFGNEQSAKIAKKKLDDLLAKGDPESAAIVQGAIESFAHELADVLQRFLKLKSWKDAECLVFGGGFAGSRVGELAIGRASVLLKNEKIKTEIRIIRHDPDEAGLIGAAHLAPTWMFKAQMFKSHDAILAVDIGGTNIRAGIVCLNLKDADDLSKAEIDQFELWRHGDEKPSRNEAVDGLIGMLKRLTKAAKKEKLGLAPFIGIGCPGRIDADGSIEGGGQNLPGNWESNNFNLPAVVHEAIPAINDNETTVLMHNDAVVQGLSEAPFMRDVGIWAAFTIGTGLGNALYENREQ
jgi:predicted NBD/HSP70 family sugar kinase